MYEGKLNIVQKEMKRLDVDVLGISEMKWTGSEHFRSANNTVMYSGHNTNRKNGVGMIIKNQVSKSLIGYKEVNDRIIYIRVKAHLVNITCVQVYAPTTSADTADIEDFYRNLHLALNEMPRKYVLILMGDWNSKIGKREKPGTVGRYGLGSRNEARERLLEFCEENALFITNTYFEQPERRLYARISPDAQYKNQIEYILGRGRWRNAFQSVKTRPDADCGSDHELLTATLRIKVKNTKQMKKGWKLDINNIPEEYKNETEQKLATINLLGRNSEEIWKVLKDTFKEVADKPILRTEKENGPIWMSQDTLRVVENRLKMKMEGNWVEARKLNGEIKKESGETRKTYLKKKCSVLEEHNEKGRTRELHQQIREITGKPKIHTGSLKSRAGIHYIEKDKIIRRWKEYTEDLYKMDPNTSVDFQEKAHAQEPLVMKSKVRKARRGITGNKAGGVDELPIEQIKAAGEAAITALCQQIWKSNLWP